MIPPVSFSPTPQKPTAHPAAVPRFGNADRFTRFGAGEPPDDDAIPPPDAELLDHLKELFRNDPESILTAMEGLDKLYFSALDEGDCDKAREYIAKKDKLEDLLAADADDVMLYLDTEALVDEAMAGWREHRQREAENDIDWATALLESDLIEPAMAETTGKSLREERHEVSMQLCELSLAVDRALAEHRDEEALALYEEFKNTRNRRDSLGYDD